MTKRNGPNKVLLGVALVSFTLGLMSIAGATGASARVVDAIQAPPVSSPDSNRRDVDPLQAPRGQELQMPRGGLGGDVGNGRASDTTVEL
jgi:hypothetical protein